MPKFGACEDDEDRVGEFREWAEDVPIVSSTGKTRGWAIAALIDATKGYYVSVGSVRKAFESMEDACGLPGNGESGMS